MGDSRGKRVWQYTMADISSAAGVPIRTLKEHRQTGTFDPGNIVSIAWYIVSRRIRNFSAMAMDEEGD